MSKTLQSFIQDELRDSESLRKRLKANLTDGRSAKIVLNLFQLEFDFEKQAVGISYYVKDKQYPDERIGFQDFLALLRH